MMYFVKVLVEVIIEYIISKECIFQKILIFNMDFVCYEFVKEEFSRFIRNVCNLNGYFESVIFVDCSLNF